jgi:hypothetical protein
LVLNCRAGERELKNGKRLDARAAGT